MSKDTNSSSVADQGTTAVITHRVREGQQAGYNEWLEEIGPICRNSLGILDLQIIRPIPNITTTYTVILRFDTHEHLKKWMDSRERKQLIEKVRPLLAHDDNFSIHSGLDFWFIPEGAKTKAPVRWKQFLITWSAIYPLVLGIPLVVTPVLRKIGAIQNRYIDTLFVTGAVVLLMVYLVMPHYTKLVKHWLFKGSR
ncbi:MAG: antibiotic biosynthesis monooxygenase [Pseudomonadota bacterium]